jgi:hypothetical protein
MDADSSLFGNPDLQSLVLPRAATPVAVGARTADRSVLEPRQDADLAISLGSSSLHLAAQETTTEGAHHAHAYRARASPAPAGQPAGDVVAMTQKEMVIASLLVKPGKVKR